MLLFTAVPFVHLVVRALVVYHPSKVEPLFVGVAVGVYCVPAATVTAPTALPPLDSKVIV